MEDKTFELLTKMYNEFSVKFDKIEGRFGTVEKEIKDINTRLTKIGFCLKNEIKPDVKASLEVYRLVYEKLQEQQKDIDKINSKLENKTLRSPVLRVSGKKYCDLD